MASQDGDGGRSSVRVEWEDGVVICAHARVQVVAVGSAVAVLVDSSSGAQTAVLQLVARDVNFPPFIWLRSGYDVIRMVSKISKFSYDLNVYIINLNKLNTEVSKIKKLTNQNVFNENCKQSSNY